MAMLQQVENPVMDLRAVEQAFQLYARKHRLLVEVKLKKIHEQFRRVIWVLI